MPEEIAHMLFEAFANERYGLYYSGSFHDGHTAGLIRFCEVLSADSKARSPQRNRLAFLLVEAYQNVVRHRPPVPPRIARTQARSMLLVRGTEDHHNILSVNPMLVAEVPGLEQQLASLEGLDRDGLKERFMTGLSSGQGTVRGGAGLGLIEMMRRSGHPLQHQILLLNEGLALLALHVRFGHLPTGRSPGIQDALDLRAAFSEQDVLLAYKGCFFPGMVDALFQLVQKDLEDRHSFHQRGRLLASAADLFFHQDQIHRPGTFVLVRTQEGVRLSLGREMSKTEVLQLDADVRLGDPLPRTATQGHGMQRATLELASVGCGPLQLWSTPRGAVMFAVLHVGL
jgi:Family of unknown function (DUF6272)